MPPIIIPGRFETRDSVFYTNNPPIREDRDGQARYTLREVIVSDPDQSYFDYSRIRIVTNPISFLPEDRSS